LDISHPVNNFQYLHVRILEGDAGQIKVDGISFVPQENEQSARTFVEPKIVEKKHDSAGGNSWIIMDLGDNGFPLSTLTVSSNEKQFSKIATVFSAGSPVGNAWSKIASGPIFRVRMEETTKEQLSLNIDPISTRYIKMEFTGGKGVFYPEKVLAFDQRSLALFHHDPAKSYRILFGNSSPDPAFVPEFVSENRSPISLPMAQTEKTERVVKLTSQPDIPKKEAPQVQPIKQYKWLGYVGMALLFVGLLLLFMTMMRSRSMRKSEQEYVIRNMRT
jgi:hypothetical protein